MFIKALRFKETIPLVLGFSVISMLIFFPSSCFLAAKSGFELAVTVVFPSLFPFMVASRYIILSGGTAKISPLFAPAMRHLFKLPAPASTAFILGIISGYPVGASAVAELVKTKQISREQGEHMLCFCNNSGPLFIIGSVGVGMLGSPVYGYILYSIHILSAILTGILLRNKAPDFKSFTPKKDVPKVNSPFTTAVTSSMLAMLNIIAYIVFFAVIIKIVTLVDIINSDISSSLLSGILEMTNGIYNLSNITMNTILKISMISALIGFSGICVLYQTKDIIESQCMSIKKYFKGKIIFALISFIITYTVLSFIPETASVFRHTVATVPTNPSIAVYFWCSLIPSIIILILARKK